MFSVACFLTVHEHWRSAPSMASPGKASAFPTSRRSEAFSTCGEGGSRFAADGWGDNHQALSAPPPCHCEPVRGLARQSASPVPTVGGGVPDAPLRLPTGRSPSKRRTNLVAACLHRINRNYYRVLPGHMPRGDSRSPSSARPIRAATAIKSCQPPKIVPPPGRSPGSRGTTIGEQSSPCRPPGFLSVPFLKPEREPRPEGKPPTGGTLPTSPPAP